VAAALDAPALDELAAAVKEYDDEAAAVADRVDAPDLLAAAMAPAPDLVALSTAEELARADDEAAAARLALCASAAEALAGIDERLRAHLAGTAPLLERSRTLSDLSRCLDGTGGENARRMSLSAYVLAARLEQVAEAASLRLAAMSGGRYTLVHSDEADRGRGRAGLALRVVDGWTGRHRDTATLSGGESFYTSLALALGLADVVTAEAGGACVETLFVDEGFGSLDDETLEEVMDVLDGLRAGGRAVGLVSHVPELRVRIPSRLEVVKTRTGSRLRQESA
jgi:exonuclease SbcC